MAEGSSTEGRVHAIPIDGNATSEHAFNWYMKNYHQANDKVVLMHIHQTPQIPSMGLMSGNLAVESYRDTVELSIKESMATVNKFEGLCKVNNIPYSVVMKDDFHSPGHMIIDLAKENQANSIIMGKRGFGPLKRILLGSTSDYVLHHADMPVLIVPPNQEQ